jgi:hypothetical protein
MWTGLPRPTEGSDGEAIADPIPETTSEPSPLPGRFGRITPSTLLRSAGPCTVGERFALCKGRPAKFDCLYGGQTLVQERPNSDEGALA